MEGAIHRLLRPLARRPKPWSDRRMSLYRWDELERLGMTQADVLTRLKTGQLERGRRDTDGSLVADDPLTRHRRLIKATWLSLMPGATISHFSAAALLGLPLPGMSVDRVWITRPGTSGKGHRSCTSAVASCPPRDHSDRRDERHQPGAHGS